MLFVPCSMRRSFHPMAGSYLETVCSHVRWKRACANLRRQTSSVIMGNNNSHDKWCDQQSQARNNEKTESTTGIEPVTFRTPVACYNRPKSDERNIPRNYGVVSRTICIIWHSPGLYTWTTIVHNLYKRFFQMSTAYNTWYVCRWHIYIYSSWRSSQLNVL